MKKIIIILAIMLTIPCVASADRMWYSTEEQDRINARMDELQVQISSLQQENIRLQSQSSAGEAGTENCGDRLTSVEARVSKLESLMDFIQQKVIATLQTAIGIFQKLVK